MALKRLFDVKFEKYFICRCFASVVCVALLSVLIAFSIEILMWLFFYIGKHAIRPFGHRKNAKIERNNS